MSDPTQFKVTTETGSFYLVDTKAKTARRLPAPGSKELLGDTEPLSYTRLRSLKIGSPLSFVWMHEGCYKLRETSPVVSIEYFNDHGKLVTQ